MALTYQTTSGLLVIPGSYPSITVQASASGVASNGIVALIGEADAGPDFSAETDLNANAYGADQAGDIAAKYKSGNLVDAYNACVSAANDAQINGSLFRVVPVKTNVSIAASGTLTNLSSTTYATLKAQQKGADGNLLYYVTSTKTQEQVPTTGSFTLLAPAGNVTYKIRIDGGTRITGSLTAGGSMLPPNIVSALNTAVTGQGGSVTGGTDRTILTNTEVGAVDLTVSHSGNVITITNNGNFHAAASVGDTLYIPTGSAYAGAGSANVGSYVVTAAGFAQIVATKLINGPGGTVGSVTAPVNVSATTVAATTDIRCFAPAVITFSGSASNSSNHDEAIDGIGKTLEIADGANVSNQSLSDICYALSTTRATFVSTSSAPKLLTSAAEYAVNLNVYRASDNISESLFAGGQIGLQIAYTGTTATLTIATANGVTSLATTVSGGSGASLSIADISKYPTIADLVAFIATQTGYKALVGTAVIGAMPSSALDEVSGVGICSENQNSANGTLNGRIKVDAAKFYDAITKGSSVVTLTTVPVIGLPDATNGAVSADNPATFMSGGTKGATSAQSIVDALAALEAVTCNFVIPLFSRDAAADIADGLTDASSAYTIAAIHAGVRTHVNNMSTLKRRRNRQSVCSIRDTFATVQETAANMAAYRVNMTFQDVKRLSAAGAIKQYQPWMGAVLAAGMQAAAFYKGIVRKGINASGALQAAADFKDTNDSQVEDALLAGLMPMRVAPGDTAISWVSDQTTYGKDDNFVFNSFQATYVADIIALTCSQQMEKAFVGQSVADISAQLALATLESILDNLRRLKLIAPSDDAPRGYRNAVVKISGPAMVVSVEVKLAGLIYFIPINIYVSPVQQSASQ